TCALTNLPEEAHMLVQHVGEIVFEVCDEFGIECFLPHRYNDPEGDEGARSKPAPRIYVEDRSRANEANLVVVYVGYPSWGGGFEWEMATQPLAPVLLIGTDRHPVLGVSRMVRGAPTVRVDLSLDYAQPEELKRKMRDAISTLLPAVKGHRERV